MVVIGTTRSKLDAHDDDDDDAYLYHVQAILTQSSKVQCMRTKLTDYRDRADQTKQVVVMIDASDEIIYKHVYMYVKPVNESAVTDNESSKRSVSKVSILHTERKMP